MGSGIERWLQTTNPDQKAPTPAVPPVSDTENWLRETSPNKLGPVVPTVDPTDAARAARVKALQTRTGLPADLISRNVDEVAKQAAQADFDPVQFQKQFPNTATWLSKQPENAAIAWEDLPHLSIQEEILGALIQGVYTGWKQSKQGRLGYDVQTARGHMTDQQKKDLDQLNKEIGSQIGGRGFLNYAVGQAGTIIGQMAESAPSALTSGVAGAIGAGTAGLAGGPLTWPSIPALALGGFGVGTTYGFMEYTRQQEGGQAYLEMSQMKDENGNPFPEDQINKAATAVGVVNALLEMGGTAIEAIPFKKAVNSFMRQSVQDALVRPTMRKAMIHFGESYASAMAAETGTEVMQELSNVLAEEWVKHGTAGFPKTPEEREAAIERLADIAKQTAAGMTILAFPGAFAHGAGTAIEARRAARAEQLFKALGENVAESETFKKLPQAIQELVEQQTKDGPLENVYIPASIWNEYWQGKKVDPGAMAEHVTGNKAQWTEATDTGGDVVVPTSKYATAIAPTEHNAFFAQELRTGPNRMSAREAKEAVEEQAKAAEIQRDEMEEKRKASAEAVTQNVFAQLRNMGMNEQGARTYSEALYGRVFQTLGRLTGIDPKELFDRFNLTITKPEEMTTAPDNANAITLPQWAQDSHKDPVIKQYEAWRAAELDADIAPELRVIARSKARNLEPAAKAAIQARFDAANAEYKERTGQSWPGALEQPSAPVPVHVRKELSDFVENLRKNFNYSRDVGNAGQIDQFEQLKYYERLADIANKGTFEDLRFFLVMSTGSKYTIPPEEYTPNLHRWIADMILDPPNLRVLDQTAFSGLRKAAMNELRKAAQQLEDMMDKDKDLVGEYDDEVSAFLEAAEHIENGYEEEAINELKSLFEFKPLSEGPIKSGLPLTMKWLNQADRTFFQGAKPTQIVALPAGFHSKAESLVTQKMGNHATFEQIRAILKEVKSEERKWLGIDQWLNDVEEASKASGQKGLNKDVVQAYLENHRLNIVEVQKTHGGMSEDEEADAFNEAVNDNIREYLRGEIRQIVEDISNNGWPAESHPDKVEALSWKVESNEDGTFTYRFPIMPFMHRLAASRGMDLDFYTKNMDMHSEESKYFEPVDQNGDIMSFNSRVAALRYLHAQMMEFLMENYTLMEEVFDAATEATNDTFDPEAYGVGGDAPYRDYTLPGGENYRVILFTLPKMGDKGYTSTHWRNDPNVFAHLRTTDRIGPDGGKMLFIEEIQSDLHQQGRDAGYIEDVDARGWTATLEGDEGDKVWHVRDAQGRTLDMAPISVAPTAAEAIRQVITGEESDVGNGKSPDAPFRSTWHEFVFKRALRMAAEEGYDHVSWTTGEQQNDRYSLTKHVDELHAEPVRGLAEGEELQYILRGYKSNQEATNAATGRMDPYRYKVFEQVVSQSALGDYVGKELAVKLLSQPMEEGDPTSVVLSRINEYVQEHASEIGYVSDDTLARFKERGGFVAGMSESWTSFSQLYGNDHKFRLLIDEYERSLKVHPGTHVLKGEAMQVGGTGMKGFYDGMLVKFANHFGKKYGAKVGETQVRTGDVEFQHLFSENATTPSEAEGWRQVESDNVGRRYERYPTETVHHLQLTDQIKQAALKNEFTLYQFGKASKGKMWQAAMEDLHNTMEDIDAKVQEYDEGKGLPETFAAFAADNPEMAVDFQWLHRMQIAIEDRDPDVAFRILSSLDPVRQKHLMQRLPDAFKWIMRAQPLNQGKFGKMLETDRMRTVWERALSPEEQRTILKNAGLHDVSIDAAVGTKWNDLQPAVKEMVEPAVREQFATRLINEGKFNIKDALYPLLGQGGEGEAPRGRIRISESSINIELLRNADLSTFIHETGHFFLEVLQDINADEFNKDASPQLKKDYDTVLSWMGAKRGEPITREQHEMFARAFEQYLMEGRAPVPALQSVFIRFKVWLLTVYQSVKELNVQLTDEVRRVFDRMLASEEEIYTAQKQQNMKPIFEGPELVGKGKWLSPEQAQLYNEALQRADAAASEEMAAKIMKDWKNEQANVWGAERAKVRGEVAAEADKDPVLRARSILQRGKLPSGADLPEDMPAFKLSKNAILADYGESTLKEMPKPLMWTRNEDEAIHPDMAADVLGFSSGRELIDKLFDSKDPDQWIEHTTNERMRSRRYRGNPLSPAELPVEAMKAVHSEKRAQFLHKELEYLAGTSPGVAKQMMRKMVRRIPPLEQVREGAQQNIAQKVIRNINPQLYLRAEQTAAREALEAFQKGDIELAVDRKLKELVNHELYRAANDARDEVEKATNYMERFSQKRTRERIGKAGGSYLEQIDSFRDRFDFAHLTEKELNKRESLRAFMDEQAQLGKEPDIPDELINEAYRKNYKEIPLSQLRDIRDAVKQIEHLARTKNKLLAMAKQRDKGRAIEEMNAQITAFHKLKDEPPNFAPGLRTRIKEGVRGIVAAHTKMEFLFEWLDGNQEQGPAWRYLFKPFIDAENNENAMMRDATKKVRSIFGVYSRMERSAWFYKKVTVPGMGTFTKSNLLSVALNWGNEYNREALMTGYKWTEAQVSQLLDHLDKRDWEVVQSVWDYLDTFWPAAQNLEKRINGIAPEKVEASPFSTKHGQMRGGYYPIAFDRKLSWRQAVLDSKEQTRELYGGVWAKAMTKHGHLKERVGTGGKPVRIDLGILSEHIKNVIHDLTHREAIIDVNGLIEAPELRHTIEGAVGTDMYRQIRPWLMNIAARKSDFTNPIEGLIAHARTGATTVNLGWKLTTAVVQFLSATNTIKEIGPVHFMSGLADVYGKPWKFKRTWEFVTSRSEFMHDRLSNYDRDVMDTLKRMNVAGVDAGPLSVVSSNMVPIRDSFFMLVGLFDMGVSLPSWMGAYQKAMDGKVENLAKGDEQVAIDYADKVVRTTQGVGNAKDLAMVQRGPETYRAFTMFYTYFSGLFNQFAKSTHQLRLDKNVPRYVASLALLWFIPAVLQDLVLGRGPGEDDDDDAWAKWIATREITYPFQTVILLRDIVNGIEHEYSASAAFDAFKALSGTGKAVTAAARGEDVTRQNVRDAVNAAGYITHLPTKQLWLTGEYFHDWMTGDEEPESPAEFMWRSLVTGKPKE